MDTAMLKRMETIDLDRLVELIKQHGAARSVLEVIEKYSPADLDVVIAVRLKPEYRPDDDSIDVQERMGVNAIVPMVDELEDVLEGTKRAIESELANHFGLDITR